jgi:hypothetical protein
LSGVERLARAKLNAMASANEDLRWARRKLRELLANLLRQIRAGKPL